LDVVVCVAVVLDDAGLAAGDQGVGTVGGADALEASGVVVVWVVVSLLSCDAVACDLLLSVLQPLTMAITCVQVSVHSAGMLLRSMLVVS
jgi:hypothetical protein